MKTIKFQAFGIATLLMGGIVIFGAAESNAQVYTTAQRTYSNAYQRIPGTTVWVPANTNRVGNVYVQPNYWNGNVLWPTRGFLAPTVPSRRSTFVNGGFNNGGGFVNPGFNTFVNPGGFNSGFNTFVNPGSFNTFTNSGFNSGF